MSAHRWPHGLFLLAVTSLTVAAREAAAQESAAPPTWGVYYPGVDGGRRRVEAEPVAPGEGREQRVASAAAMTGLSFGILSAALVTFAVSQAGTEVCGLTGCFTHPNRQLELAAGAIAAAGGGMALVAVPTLMDALVVDRGAPKHAGRMGWGLAMTAVGVGSAASMAVLAHAMTQERNSETSLPGDLDRHVFFSVLLVQGLSAATHLGVGIPLWANGGRSRDDVAPFPMQVTVAPAGMGAGIELSF